MKSCKMQTLTIFLGIVGIFIFIFPKVNYSWSITSIKFEMPTSWLTAKPQNKKQKLDC